MKHKALKYIIILAILVITGIFMIQFGILKKTYDLNEEQFHQAATVALREVVWQMLEQSGHTARFDNIEPVERLANNYYLVNVNDIFDEEMLGNQLREQFKRHSIHIDFEYAVYLPEMDSMFYAEYVCAGSDSCNHTPTSYFPKSEKYQNYFAVHFPTLNPFIKERLKGWYFMTSLLLLVLTFFGYTIWVIIKQRQLSEIQKIFINNLTHELKTPISSIGLAAHVLRDPDIANSPERLHNYIRIINEQSDRLAKNVEKVLNLAALEKNKIHLVKEEINLPEFVGKTVNRFSQSEVGMTSILKVTAPDPAIRIWADPFHLGNVLQNILENAVKYCKTQPQIETSILRDKRTIHVRIADNGIGIPNDLKKKIFKKFYRVPTGNVHDVKGFGLGLDYVHKMVVAHSWKIKVTDNPRGGSIFTLTIPQDHE